MEDEIWVFHENMERYLDKYLEQRYEMLVEKNNDAKAHYKKLQEAVITKHKEMKATVPNDFNWELYYKDPAYLQTALHRQVGKGLYATNLVLVMFCVTELYVHLCRNKNKCKNMQAVFLCLRLLSQFFLSTHMRKSSLVRVEINWLITL